MSGIVSQKFNSILSAEDDLINRISLGFAGSLSSDIVGKYIGVLTRLLPDIHDETFFWKWWTENRVVEEWGGNVLIA